MDHLEQNLSDPIENAAVPSAQNAIRVSNAVIQNISYDKDTAYVTIAYNNCTRCNAPEMLVTLIVSGNTILLDENGDLITPGRLADRYDRPCHLLDQYDKKQSAAGTGIPNPHLRPPGGWKHNHRKNHQH